MRCRLLVIGLVSLVLTTCGWSAVIVVGDHPLLANTPNQTVQIFVTGGNPVEGLNLYAQIADGGTGAGGTMVGPKITDVDILVGTIFSSNNTGSEDPGSLPQLAARTTTTAGGTVNAIGLLATLTIDTTGFNSGAWPLNLGDTQNGPTDFAGLPIVITDGSISVPEPTAGTMILATFSLILFSATARRRASASPTFHTSTPIQTFPNPLDQRLIFRCHRLHRYISNS